MVGRAQLFKKRCWCPVEAGGRLPLRSPLPDKSLTRHEDDMHWHVPILRRRIREWTMARETLEFLVMSAMSAVHPDCRFC